MDRHEDPLLRAIREAGETPPPPDREAAFERAMAAAPGARAISRARWLAVLAAAIAMAIPAGALTVRAIRGGDPPAPPRIDRQEPVDAEPTNDPGASVRQKSPVESEASVEGGRPSDEPGRRGRGRRGGDTADDDEGTDSERRRGRGGDDSDDDKGKDTDSDDENGDEEDGDESDEDSEDEDEDADSDE